MFKPANCPHNVDRTMALPLLLDAGEAYSKGAISPAFKNSNAQSQVCNTSVHSNAARQNKVISLPSLLLAGRRSSQPHKTNRREVGARLLQPAELKQDPAIADRTSQKKKKKTAASALTFKT